MSRFSCHSFFYLITMYFGNTLVLLYARCIGCSLKFRWHARAHFVSPILPVTANFLLSLCAPISLSVCAHPALFLSFFLPSLCHIFFAVPLFSCNSHMHSLPFLLLTVNTFFPSFPALSSLFLSHVLAFPPFPSSMFLCHVYILSLVFLSFFFSYLPLASFLPPVSFSSVSVSGSFHLFTVRASVFFYVCLPLFHLLISPSLALILATDTYLPGLNA